MDAITSQIASKHYASATIKDTKNDIHNVSLDMKNIIEFHEHGSNIRSIDDKKANKFFKNKIYKMIIPCKEWFVKNVPLKKGACAAELIFIKTKWMINFIS